MAVPSTAADLSTTAASNSPSGSESIGTSLDDYLRAIQAILKAENSKGTDIASASTIDVPSAGKYFVVTGTTGITGISDDWTGRTVFLEFSGALTLTHSASLILPGAANITTVAGDVFGFCNESTGVWRCCFYQPYGGNQPYDAQLSSLIRQQSKSAAYTTVLGDGGKHILHPSSDNNARTFTIDSNANVAYPIGTAITFVNQINTVTIAITADTLTLAGSGSTGSRTLAANGIATALKIGTTSWIISGTGLS